MSEHPSRPRRSGLTRWSLRRRSTVASVLLVVVFAAAIAAVAVAINDLDSTRARLLDRIGPMVISSEQLTTAVVDQETGVRGFAITVRPEFRTPYDDGRSRQRQAEAELRPLLTDLPGVEAKFEEALRHVEVWRAEYAEPTIEQAAAARLTTDPEAGKVLFDRARSALDELRADLEEERVVGRAALNDSATALVRTCVITLGALLLLVVVASVLLRSAVVAPLSRLSHQVRQVADGRFGHRVEVTGPAEIAGLAEDVDVMRARILYELEVLRQTNTELDTLSADLKRSNAELEQFAYVASHDLQEPLRKVASFCQLLERRYSDKLDDNARQYIGFAVDGARRMQVLINDLLSFSRVGRHTGKHVDVPVANLVESAQRNLGAVLEETGATVEVPAELPVVRGEVPLLTAVFQNLIGNAVKFRAEEPPVVRIGVERDGDEWVFSVSDNGIGVEPQFAERVFVIFQRLHGKDAYPGTGIGLAMCRKIVEFHGGRIWLDTEHAESGGRGTTIRFTLPVITPPEPQEPAAEPEPAAAEPRA
ncbi:Phytochrome, two-component sensor histidine kinase [Actinokineospora spheciospongiae]|uniref:histidine kinase n=1 Tax=Actinokineospora spheciospongiae TaxID=909613 RepID=W7ITD2_9PSEU|nr:ATP-binding protein [Actinokineospora spheciospongiae]EWC60022.1 Phytochrome, two-component sensor histidine kinase [Actinokineospora spheciospongiae]